MVGSDNVVRLHPEIDGLGEAVAAGVDRRAKSARRATRRKRRGERSTFGTVEQMRSGRFQARFVCPLDNQRYTAPTTFDTSQAAWGFLEKERVLIANDPDGWSPPKVRLARMAAD